MFKRTTTQAHSDSARFSHLPFLAALVVLAVAIVSFEARAQSAQVAALTAPEAVAATAETQGAGDGWSVNDKASLAPLNLDTSFLLTDTAGSKQGRVARIASCHEASLARYDSEVRSDRIGHGAGLDSFNAKMTNYRAQKHSQRQFDNCLR